MDDLKNTTVTIILDDLYGQTPAGDPVEIDDLIHTSMEEADCGFDFSTRRCFITCWAISERQVPNLDVPILSVDVEWIDYGPKKEI